jgi:hypothetical protein
MRACARTGLALYAVFLLAAPLAHHDFACHRANPSHCPSCVAAESGRVAPGSAAVISAGLPTADRLSAASCVMVDSWLSPATIGRAPPVVLG